MKTNREARLLAAALIPYSAAALALVLRMFARRIMKVQLVWEDFLATFAFLVGSGHTFVGLHQMGWEQSSSTEDAHSAFADDPFDDYWFRLWIDIWLYTFSVGLSKIVMLGWYWRIFSKTPIRQPIRILFVCSIGWMVVRVALLSSVCQPVGAFWDLDDYTHCHRPSQRTVVSISMLHLVIEAAILLCPVYPIYNLRLPTKKKLAVAAMFTSGALACALSVLSTITENAHYNVNATAFKFDNLVNTMMGVCDVNLASLATSLPLLRPVFLSLGRIFDDFKSAPRSSPSDVHLLHLNSSSGYIRGRDSLPSFANTDGIMRIATLSDASTAQSSQNTRPRQSDLEAQRGVHVRREVFVQYSRT
ncbi:hypothetical protein GQ44DRAFT_659162 [Phaeosphaeriaceae sp. PMI808]|nr:hypothetical protein GQ44DRAFT_659162 [Phaeosphaeriaceae sp. PMI808]